MSLKELKTLMNNEKIINFLKDKTNELAVYKENLKISEKQHEQIKIDLTYLTEKRDAVKINQEVLADLESELQELQNIYTSLVNYKDLIKSDNSLYNAKMVTTMMELLNFEITLDHIECDNWKIKFIFDGCSWKHIITHFNVFENTFNLEAIEPKPPTLDVMKELLKETQDISGLLYAAKCYFSKIQT